jgi:putative iron-dependent peroxidase
MLVNMFVGRPPGNTDRILDFSTAITGSLFFAPTAAFLDDLPDSPSAAGPAVVDDAAAGNTSAGDGSLGIGSLKG